MAGAASHTSVDGGSEIVPGQEAAVISEGRGTGASGLAVWSPRDVAVAMVIAVIHRTGKVSAESRVLQSCKRSRRISRTATRQLTGDEPPVGA